MVDSTGIRRRFGDWIWFRARAERTPMRLGLTISKGDLPDEWSESGRHASTWAGLAGLVLLLPFVALITTAALRAIGIGGPYDWLASSSYAILAATISLFIGIPVAIVMNLWRITRLGLHRSTGSLEFLVAFEFAPLQLIVVAAAVIIGGAFVAHLAVDSLACLKGVRTAC